MTALRKEVYAWWVVFVLSLSLVVAYIDRQIINLLVEPMKHDLGISDMQISILQGAAFGLTHALLAVPLGRLADARSRRGIILAGIVCWTAACAGSGLAVSFAMLFAMRMAIGVGEATLTPSGYSMLADYFPRDRLARAISIFLGSGFVGSGIAFIAGGWLLGRLQQADSFVLPLVGSLHPWQAAFLLAATPGLLCFVLMLTVREPPRRGLGTASGEVTPPFGEVLRFLWERRRTIGTIYLGFSLLAATQFALGAWTPSFFIRTYGWTATEIGYAFGLYYMILGTGGVLAGGWLCDRLTRRGHADANLRTGLIAGACALPFVIAFPLMPNGTAALALLAPATFFGTMPFGAGTAALPLLAPNRMRGQVVAMYLLVANLLGQAVGPVYVATLTDHAFHDPAHLRFSLAIACGSLLTLAILVIASGLKHVGAALADSARSH